MDRNAITGIVLIFGILVVFSIMNQPSQEEIEQAKRKQDSIAQVEAAKALEQQQQVQQQNVGEATSKETIEPASAEGEVQEKIDQFGVFGKAAIGEEKFYTLENNIVKLKFSNKGGRIFSVELKHYQTHDSLPLMLFENPEQFGLNFFSQNRSIQTDQFYFEPTVNRQEIVVNGPEVTRTNEGKIKFNEDNKRTGSIPSTVCGQSTSVQFFGWNM